jgi:hypothetical protein
MDRVMNWPDAPMHEARITTHIIFGICVGQRDPWGSERGQSSVTTRRAVPAVAPAVCTYIAALVFPVWLLVRPPLGVFVYKSLCSVGMLILVSSFPSDSNFFAVFIYSSVTRVLTLHFSKKASLCNEINCSDTLSGHGQRQYCYKWEFQ